MSNDTERIKCLHCGTYNLVPLSRVEQGQTPICGECKNYLYLPNHSKYEPITETAISNEPYPGYYEHIKHIKNNPFRKKWIIPCVILTLLLLAWAFRWDYTASKSIKFYIQKWKTDRWTGQQWVETYTPRYVKEAPLEPYKTESPQATRENMTILWVLATIITVSWLLYVTWIGPWRKRRKVAFQ